MQGTWRKHTLFLDSGCSGHMTGRKSLLAEFERRAGPTVSFGDGNKGETLGYGSINLGNVIIKNVALDEELKHTLVSISQLSDKGYQAHFDNTKCTITSVFSGETMIICQRHRNIYEASLSNKTQGKVRCLFSKASNEKSWKWYKALSHLNSKKMDLLIKKRETATAEGESFLENQESLTLSKI